MGTTTLTEPATRYRWVALGVVFGGQWSVSLAMLVVPALAPLLQSELGLSNTEVGVFSSAGLAGIVAVLLVAGSLTDRSGVRKVMILGQTVGALFLFSMFAAASFWQASAVMLAVGMTLGAPTPGLTKAVTDWFPARARATAMGLKQSATTLAGVFAAAALPSLALAAGWRGAFAAVGLVALAVAAGTALLYRDARPTGPARVRRAGMRAGLGTVVRNRGLWALSATSLLFLLVQGALTTYLAVYFNQVVLATSVPDERARIVAAGGFLALCQMGGVFGRVFWGLVSDRVLPGRRRVVMAAIGALATLLSLAIAHPGAGQPLWLLGLVVFAQGATALGWNGLYQTLIAETAGRGYAATGVGLSMTVSMCGQVAGPPLFGLLVDLSGSYLPAWLFLSCASAAGALVATLSARGEKRAS